MIAAVRKLVSTGPEKLASELAELRDEERAFNRGVGRLAEVEHARIDEHADTWKTQLRSLVSAGVPDLHHPNAPLIADLLALVGGVPNLHAILDEDESLDRRSVAEVEAERARFRRDIEVREVVLRRHEQAARAAAEAEALAALDREAEEALAK
jgi:hypothetical protein